MWKVKAGDISVLRLLRIGARLILPTPHRSSNTIERNNSLPTTFHLLTDVHCSIFSRVGGHCLVVPSFHGLLGFGFVLHSELPAGIDLVDEGAPVEDSGFVDGVVIKVCQALRVGFVLLSSGVRCAFDVYESDIGIDTREVVAWVDS